MTAASRSGMGQRCYRKGWRRPTPPASRTTTGRRSTGGGGDPWSRCMRRAEAAVIEAAGEGTGGLGWRCWPLVLCGKLAKKVLSEAKVTNRLSLNKGGKIGRQL
jgi:hypothetical protein